MYALAWYFFSPSNTLQDLGWIGWKIRLSWCREHVKHCLQHQLWFWIWRKNRYRQRPRSIFWIVADCKTVRIFAYSSTREQSNKRSGTRLKIESETGENGRVRLDSYATLYRFLNWFWEKKTTVLQSRIVERTRNAFISFNSEINFVQFLYKNVQLTNKIVFAFNKKIRSTFVKYAPSPPPKKKIPVAGQ